MGKKSVKVVAGVIFDGCSVLAAQRPAGKALAGNWEFPGGKVEPGETSAQALERELAEELALEVLVLDEMYQLNFTAPDNREIALHFIRALKKTGSEPAAREEQQFRWLDVSELDSVNWLETDRDFVDFLKQTAKNAE